MSELTPIIENFKNKGVSLSELDIENLTRFFKKSLIKKKQFIVQPGFVNKHRTYIIKGTFRGYVLDNEGHEHTISFAMDDWWVSDFDSFINQKLSTMFVVGLEDSIVFQISYNDEQILRDLDPKFEKYFGVNAEKGLPFYKKDLFPT